MGISALMPTISVLIIALTCFILMDQSILRYSLFMHISSVHIEDKNHKSYEKLCCKIFVLYLQLGSWWAGDSPSSRNVQLEESPEAQNWRDGNETVTFPLKGRTIKVVTIIVSCKRNILLVLLDHV